MKKIVLSGLLLSSFMFMGVMADAAPTPPVETNGKVSFIGDDDGGEEVEGAKNLIKPGTNNQVIELDENQGKSTTGGLRLAYVPNINFGNAVVSVMAKEYPAKMVKFTYKDDTTNAAKYIPPFVQVIDSRGKATGFKVNVKASKFTSAAAGGAAAHTLTGAKMKINKSTLTNQTTDKGGADAPAVNTLLKGIDNGKFITEADQMLISTVAGTGVGAATNNAASSIVFEDAFTATGSDEKYKVDSTTNALQLVVPQGDQPQVGREYISTITWTLSDTL